MIKLRIPAAFIVAFLLLGVAPAAAHRDWQLVRGPGFSVSFPSAPQVLKKERSSPAAGQIHVTTYILIVPGHVVYEVADLNGQRDFPANSMAAIMNQFAHETGATVVSAQNMQMQEYPGLVVMLQHGREVGRAFTVQAPKHVFVVMAISNPDEINSPVLSQFLNSFKVNL